MWYLTEYSVDHGCCFGFCDNLGKWPSKSYLTPPRWRGRGNGSTSSHHIITRLRKVNENVDPAKFRRLRSASPHLGFWVSCCWCGVGGPPLRVRLRECPWSVCWVSIINTFMGRKYVFLDRQPRPHPKGVGPASLKVLWLSTCAHTAWEITTTFCISNYIDVRKIFTPSTANSDSRSVCCS